MAFLPSVLARSSALCASLSHSAAISNIARVLSASVNWIATERASSARRRQWSGSCITEFMALSSQLRDDCSWASSAEQVASAPTQSGVTGALTKSPAEAGQSGKLRSAAQPIAVRLRSIPFEAARVDLPFVCLRGIKVPRPGHSNSPMARALRKPPSTTRPMSETRHNTFGASPNDRGPER
jgi:hypothetical protein